MPVLYSTNGNTHNNSQDESKYILQEDTPEQSVQLITAHLDNLSEQGVPVTTLLHHLTNDIGRIAVIITGSNSELQSSDKKIALNPERVRVILNAVEANKKRYSYLDEIQDYAGTSDSTVNAWRECSTLAHTYPFIVAPGHTMRIIPFNIVTDEAVLLDNICSGTAIGRHCSEIARNKNNPDYEGYYRLLDWIRISEIFEQNTDLFSELPELGFQVMKFSELNAKSI
ncbi:MAG: hypothetical protein Q9M91_04510 [Candidatus Dojkabacteria bacterium]|nr:hypothetical protein [Candidatus Dojkabacteria bacterium]MDQ7021074.1 hypothetical protein [Candidatus Dojkabacteria bacterium]